ncbi:MULTISPECIES: nuclease-related domain-containing protein [unclassified Jeotgalibaca]|uniref:nuclease-related domain-containing protein n=1 Tax=unclassified Jeotgalibaca TaxID=2621505 RepID=UPI003FD10858
MKPITLLIMEALHERMELGIEDKRYLGQLEKGFDGEFKFCERLTSMTCPHILLTDMSLNPKYAGQVQIDALLLVKDSVIIYEVKNYRGDWIYGEESYRNGEIEIPNPMIQALRSKNNFKNFLKEIGYVGINVEVCVAFVNPDFTLYQAPAAKNVIFVSQIKNHIARHDQYPRPIAFEFHELAVALRAAALPGKAFQKQIPAYSFESLRKGVRCGSCGSLAQRVSQRTHQCKRCGCLGLNNDGVVRAIEEFQLLFPGKRLTGRVLMEWCDGVLSNSQCKKIIKEKLTQNGE